MVGRSTIFYGALPVLVYIPRDASAPCATFTTKTSLSSLTANLVTAVDQWPQLADFPVVIGDILPSTTGVLDRISLSAAFHELRLALVHLRNVGIWCEAHSPCSFRMTRMSFALSDLQPLSRAHLERTCLFRCWVSSAGPATITLKVVHAPFSSMCSSLFYSFTPEFLTTTVFYRLLYRLWSPSCYFNHSCSSRLLVLHSPYAQATSAFVTIMPPLSLGRTTQQRASMSLC